MENNLLKKVYYLLVAVLVISVINLFIGFISISNISTSSTKQQTQSQEESDEYDVSAFTEITVDEVNSLFNSKETSVIYLGRSTCSACIAFVPTLTKVQSDLKFTSYYLDISKVDTSSEAFQTFMGKLTKKIEQNINGTVESGTIADFYGYTPMTLIIKDKKAADAAVGAYNETKLTEFLNNNGIK